MNDSLHTQVILPNMQQLDLNELISYGYWAILIFVLIPMGGWIKRLLSEDPVHEDVKILVSSVATLVDSMKVLNNKVAESIKPGLLDEHLAIKKFHSVIKYSMLQMISLYHERLRKNNILKDRHLVHGRYLRGGDEVSGKLYVDLNGYTCLVNGRKMSGFLNNQGGDTLFHRITEELFENHLKKTEQKSFLNE